MIAIIASVGIGLSVLNLASGILGADGTHEHRDAALSLIALALFLGLLQ